MTLFGGGREVTQEDPVGRAPKEPPGQGPGSLGWARIGENRPGSARIGQGRPE